MRSSRDRCFSVAADYEHILCALSSGGGEHEEGK